MGMAFLNKLLKTGTTSDEVSAAGTPTGLALVASGASMYEEVNRTGTMFTVMNTTAVASVIALPTTACALGLFNNAADGGKSMVIDAVFALAIVVEATINQAGIIYYLGDARETALTDALIPRKQNGMGTGSDIALCAAGGAIMTSAAAIDWRPIGNSMIMGVTSLPGLQLYERVDGMIIIPPGRMFGLNVFTNDVTTTYTVGAVWHEAQLALS